MTRRAGSVCLLLSLLIAIPALGASRSPDGDDTPARPFDRTALQKNIIFFSPDGQLEWGIKCGVPPIDPQTQHQIEQNLATVHQENLNVVLYGATVVPVAWHVLKASNGQGDVPLAMIQRQIDRLNVVYLRRGFQFYLASVDRTTNDAWFTGCADSATDEAIKKKLAVDPAHHMNVYSCRPGGNLLGFAYYPWAAPEGNYIHGETVLYSTLPGGSAFPYNEGAVVIHETGHYLGLSHTFQNGCTDPGDFVDDTPYEAGPAYGCPVGRDSCPQAGNDPVHNYMDYSDDACSTQFTKGQETRMHKVTDYYRPSL